MSWPSRWTQTTGWTCGGWHRRSNRSGEEKGTRIVAIAGIAGTTETGSVDPLEEMADLAHEANTHFHVDACWGGSALLVDEYRPLLKGIEKADSVSIDAHKLLYCPMAMGLVLFQNEKDLNTIKQSSQYVIRRNSVDMGRFTVEGSRPFDSLKPWAALKILGRDGYRLLLRSARENTEYLAGDSRWVRQLRNAQLTGTLHPDLPLHSPGR